MRQVEREFFKTSGNEHKAWDLGDKLKTGQTNGSIFTAVVANAECNADVANEMARTGWSGAKKKLYLEQYFRSRFEQLQKKCKNAGSEDVEAKASKQEGNKRSSRRNRVRQFVNQKRLTRLLNELNIDKTKTP